MNAASESAPPRVVLDTNVLVSAALFRRGPAFELLDAIRGGALILLLSPEIVNELADVLSRPKLVARYALTSGEVSELLANIEDLGDNVATSEPSTVAVRDPKDEAILVAAIAGRADYLVTGDADLLVLADEPALRPLRIVTIRTMLDILARH